MRIKSLIHQFLVTLISIMLIGTVHADVAAHLEGFSNEFFFAFIKPRGSVNFYDEARGIIFFNSANETVTVSNLGASIAEIPGFTVVLEKNTLQIEGSRSGSIKAVFQASPDMREGVHKGRLAVTGAITAGGTGTVSFDEPISVQIIWPNPVINSTWDKKDWGKIKAGDNITKNLIINESMGYKSVDNVELTLVEFGPANLSYTKNLGTIAPRSTNNIPVEIIVPTRGLAPAKYLVSPSISTNSTVSIKFEDAFYEIPPPNISISTNIIDFNSVTFESGKDVAMQQIMLNEIGGYTPVEGLNITLKSGESGWIEFQKVDYIAPGTNIPVSFSLKLPSEASLGVKEWKYSVTTKYAGDQEIIGTVSVYFPGVEDAIKDINTVYLTLNASGLLNATGLQKELLDNTQSLLENARGETELRDITMVMSVYSGARSLTTLLEELKQVKDTDLERGGAIVILANNALKRIKIGDENLDKPQLKKHSEICFRVGNEIWRTNAESIVKLISDRAEGNKESNYRVAALYYKRGAEIYSLLNDPKAVEYDTIRKELEDRYRESIAKAINLRADGGVGLEKAHSKMIKLLDFYFVINPFSYDEVSKGYFTALEKYDTARVVFEVAGESSDADLVSKEIENTRREQRLFKNAFIIYGVYWIVLFVWFMVRVSLGLQFFKQDEDDTQLGDVVLTKEKA